VKVNTPLSMKEKIVFVKKRTRNWNLKKKNSEKCSVIEHFRFQSAETVKCCWILFCNSGGKY